MSAPAVRVLPAPSILTSARLPSGPWRSPVKKRRFGPQEPFRYSSPQVRTPTRNDCHSNTRP
ncbi:atexpb2, expb2, athexp beta 1.4 atexpb2 (expansin b2) [Musa troglodytarum]|uniref:Atexpb2, expb2, athexp beta 1.4 atexpb2 (Expansin b2) n=1 Tax=Musa troglodytarum TaxID=320322 RepID=A0A9E7F593_9LILI|nr:atexpb2, expb2, athexp beta 1.4 atexpb2 (expansin b2) [Musa troglodytarum]